MIENKERFGQRCRDTANDDRGFIVGLDDDDIRELVRAVRTAKKDGRLDLLHDKFQQLVM